MEDKSEEKSYSNLDDAGESSYRIFESYDGLEDCRLNTYNRVRYFAGQLLVPEDLTHDQNYFNSKRHLINKLVNGTGVVCGLDLKIADPRAEHLLIRINSGLAIDCCGREIVVENDKNISLKLSQRPFGETVKRLGLFLIRREFLKSPAPVNTAESQSGAQLSESRVEESYNLILKPIETSPVKIEFDKTSYNIDDKVRVELWDPDNLAQNVKDSKQRRGENGDTIKVKISSSKTKTKISLNKLRNVYQGEISLTTENGKSEQNTLAVSDSDVIKVMFDDNSFATAHVSRSSDSFILNEKKAMSNYYNKKLLKGYQEQNPAHKALHLNNQEHGVLLAILKGNNDDNEEDKQLLYIDELETDMYKEVVYNNPLLYDFISELNNRRQEVRKQPTQCAVLSDLHRITAGTIGSLKDSQYLITDPINIFEKYPLYSNKSLQFPPIIHLGRAPYKNPDNSVMGFENIDYVVLKGLYSKDEDWRVLGNEMDLDQMESISCKPLAITDNSFRLAIIKNSEVKFQENGGNTPALIVRWWAVCQFKD